MWREKEQERRERDAQTRREMEARVLANAAALDPTDRSVQAEQIRETAASIRDHRRAAELADDDADGM
jgi:uncharacterized membrane protein